jgi:hypothetical protein
MYSSAASTKPICTSPEQMNSVGASQLRSRKRRIALRSPLTLRSTPNHRLRAMVPIAQ